MGVHHRVGRVVRATLREIHTENITFMAGSIAYYAFISMLPLLLFALLVLSTIDNAALTAYLYAATESVLTPYARQLLVDSLDAASARTGVSILGGVTLLWGTSRIFRALDVAFSEIYGIEEKKGLLAQARDGLIVAVALTVAITVIVAAGVVFAVAPALPYPSVVNPLLVIAGLTVAFYPVYYVFPNVDVRPIEVLPGTVLAAVGWAVLEAVFQGYVAYAGRFEAIYGTLGSALLLLIWLYFSGLVLLVGGVVNAVLAGRIRDPRALAALDPGRREAEYTDRAGRETTSTLGRASADSPKRDRSSPSDRGSTADRSSPDGSPTAESTPLSDRTATGGVTGSPDRARAAELPHSDAEVRLAYEQLEARNERLREELRRLEADNERLRRLTDVTDRRQDRRRSVVERAKRWLFDR